MGTKRSPSKPAAITSSSGPAFKEILVSMERDGALVIPAHVNAAKAGLPHRMSGQALVNAVTDTRLHAVALCPGEAETSEQQDIMAHRKPYVRKHPLAVV